MNKDVFIFRWNGYEIEVTYVADYSKAFHEVYGYPLAHIEVKTLSPERAALPITETGYQSIFITKSEVDEAGGVKAMLLDALDEAALSREWQVRHEEQMQYSLF